MNKFFGVLNAKIAYFLEKFGLRNFCLSFSPCLIFNLQSKLCIKLTFFPNFPIITFSDKPLPKINPYLPHIEPNRFCLNSSISIGKMIEKFRFLSVLRLPKLSFFEEKCRACFRMIHGFIAFVDGQAKNSIV